MRGRAAGDGQVLGGAGGRGRGDGRGQGLVVGVLLEPHRVAEEDVAAAAPRHRALYHDEVVHLRAPQT